MAGGQCKRILICEQFNIRNCFFIARQISVLSQEFLYKQFPVDRYFLSVGNDLAPVTVLEIFSAEGSQALMTLEKILFKVAPVVQCLEGCACNLVKSKQGGFVSRTPKKIRLIFGLFFRALFLSIYFFRVGFGRQVNFEMSLRQIGEQ